MKFASNIILAIMLLFSAVIAEKPNEINPAQKIKVYYFHHTIRCQSCITIENFSYKTLSEKYPQMLKDSSIVWQSIDVDDSLNYHFEDDYKLETQALIISRTINGKETEWKNLTQIWDYMNDYNKFAKYVSGELKIFISGNDNKNR